MNTFIVWIDREHANVFLISADKMERKSFGAKMPDHHTHAHDNLDHKRQENRLFAEVAIFIKPADQLLILGPGMAKHHFQTYLTEQHPAIARKISGCETVDHPSDGQIAALAKKHFKIGEVAASTRTRQGA